MAQTDPALAPITVGRFRVVDRLGKGGMAEVFLGVPQHPLPDDPPFVALKRLLPTVAAEQPETVKMLMDEAAILSRLKHKNIVRLIDVCNAQGSTYLVMELLDGVDLSGIFKKFATAGLRIPWAFSATVVADIAEALAYAADVVMLDGRALGLVHRDISPHNIFVHADGSVRLLDFGVARAADRMTQTRSGMLKGKLAYMSPEQASGDDIDHRSDIFALGIVLYEFTVGRRPFKGKNEFTILQSVISGKITWPSEMYSNFPGELERIIKRMLARPLDERYQHAKDVAAGLRAWIATLGNVSAQLPGALMAKHFAEKLEQARAHAVPLEPVADDGSIPDDGLGLSLQVSDDIDVSGNRRRPEPSPIEKDFVDDATVLVIHRYVPAGGWRRAFDGLEGEVVVRFVTDDDARPSAAPLLQTIAALVDDIDVKLEQTPRAVVEEWQQQRAQLGHVTIASTRASCPHCGTAQLAVVARPQCSSCGKGFVAFDDGDPLGRAANPVVIADIIYPPPSWLSPSSPPSSPPAADVVAPVAPNALPSPPTATATPPAGGVPVAAVLAVLVAFVLVAVGAFFLGRGSGG